MSTANTLDEIHALAIETLDDLPELQWDVPGADGNWTVKEVVAHLCSYELLLLDLLQSVSGDAAGPTLQSYLQNKEQFDAQEVEKRRYRPAQQVEDEYTEAQLQTSSLLAQLPPERLREERTIEGFPSARSLADVIEQFTAHTRKHCLQIQQFRAQSPER